MTFSALTNRTSGNAGQFSSRGGRKVRGWIIHHAATTSLNGVLSMMSTGSRSVSANYVLGNGEIIGVVPEEWRAWTSSSPNGDGENLTVEIVNNKVGATDMTWTIGEAEYANMAKLIADSATRYGFPINRGTIIGHREVVGKYGQGYSTACPSGIDLDRLVRMAQAEQAGQRPSPPPHPLAFLSDAEQARLLALAEATRDGQLTAGGKWTHDQETLNTLRQVAGKLDAAGRKLA